MNENNSIHPGDVITAKYAVHSVQTNDNGSVVNQAVCKKGNFVVLAVDHDGFHLYGLISLRIKENKPIQDHCYKYDDSYYVVLKQKYKIKSRNVERVIFNMGQTKQYNEIVRAFTRYTKVHPAQTIGEKRKSNKKGYKIIDKNAFHMGYKPTTSIRTVGGGSFGKR